MIIHDPIELVGFARRHSRFYAELYRQLPPAPIWDQVPVVDPEAYWACKDVDFEATLTAPPALVGGFIWTTGGSTARSKRVAISNEDFVEEAKAFTPAFLAAGLAAGDRVANLTWAGALSASFILTSAILQGLPVLQLPILGNTPPEQILALCRELQPTVLLSFPFLLTRLAQLLGERGEVLPVAKLLYAGERLLPDQRALLERAFTPEQIGSFGYAAVDCGPIAWARREPEYAGAGDGPEFVPLDGYSVVEILDDDDRPVALGERGRVVVSNLGRGLSPVIRFPVGDSARWLQLPQEAAPGRPARGGVFMLDRREHLSVKRAGWVVTHADVVAEAAAVSGLSSLVQLVTRRRDGVDWLQVWVVASELDPRRREQAAAELRARLRACYPSFVDPPGGPAAPVLVVELAAVDSLALTAAGKVAPIVRGDAS